MRTIEAMRVSGFGVLACISGIACSSGIESSATSNDNLRMTGQPIDPTANLQQAETGINVSFLGTSSVVSVVYNDFTNEVPAFIIYPPGNRQILPGASLAGWSVSTDGGGSFHYGGKLTPPAGWDVLWGDPSVTGSRLDHHYAYVEPRSAALEVPSARTDHWAHQRVSGRCMHWAFNGWRRNLHGRRSRLPDTKRGFLRRRLDGH